MNTHIVTILDVLIFTCIIFLFWLLPVISNYFNVKANYYHELFIRELENNKKLFPERYIPFKLKLKRFFRKE